MVLIPVKITYNDKEDTIEFEDALTLKTIRPEDDYLDDLVKLENEDVLDYISADTALSELDEDTAMSRIATVILTETFPNVKYQNYLTPAKVKAILTDGETGLPAKIETILSSNADTSVKEIAGKIQKYFFGYLKKENDAKKLS